MKEVIYLIRTIRNLRVYQHELTNWLREFYPQNVWERIEYRKLQRIVAQVNNAANDLQFKLFHLAKGT